MLSPRSSVLLPLPFSILLLSLLSAPSLVSTQTITSPASVVQCLPVALTLEGGSAPYTVSVLPGGQVSAAPLETLPEVTAPGTVTWLVDLEAGQDITFSVRDATGALGYSAPIPILSGTSSECLGTNAGMTVSSLVPTTTIPASSVATSTVSVPLSTSTTRGDDDDETSTTSTPSSTSVESETSTSSAPTTSTASARSTSSSRTLSSTNVASPTASSAAEAATDDNGSGASQHASGGDGWKSLALALSLAIALLPLA